MKTAISIEEQLLRRADKAAREMGLSRSRLFSRAVEEYLQERQRQQVREDLDKAYAGDAPATSRRITSLLKTKLRSTIKDAW